MFDHLARIWRLVWYRRLVNGAVPSLPNSVGSRCQKLGEFGVRSQAWYRHSQGRGLD